RVGISQEAARQNEKQRKEAAQPVSLQRPNDTMQNTGDDNTNGKREASGCPLQTSSFGQSSRTAVVTRPMLGSWLFGSSGTSTELERLVKEESDLAENAAAKSELAATKLLQEDMEAMIANLQHVHLSALPLAFVLSCLHSTFSTSILVAVQSYSFYY